MVDKELDVSLLLLCLDALEAVGCNAKTVVGHCFFVELRRRQHAVRNFHGRDVHLFLTLSSVESEVEVALDHVRHIVEVGLHGIATAHFVRHLLSIGHCFLALEGCAFACCYLTTRVTQFGDDLNYGFLLHVLGWEVGIDGC